MDKKYILQIYIAGISPDTQTLIVDLKDHLTNALGNDSYSLKVVDVLDKPQLAEEDHILATPTILRREPSPVKKIILNSSDEKESIEELEAIIKE